MIAWVRGNRLLRLGRHPSCRCARDSGRGARRTPHTLTPATARPLFSITFSLCSGDFEASPAISSAGLSDRASSPTTLLSSSATRSSGSGAGAVREPPPPRPACSWRMARIILGKLYWRRNRIERMETGLMRDALEEVEERRRSPGTLLTLPSSPPSAMRQRPACPSPHTPWCGCAC